MNKIALGLAAVLATGAVAAPAFAASDINADFLGNQLEARGVNVAQLNGSAEVYGAGKDTIRVVVELADGSTEYQYFNIDTLQPVSGAGSTRVLTQLATE
jgi:hypothetical protein